MHNGSSQLQEITRRPNVLLQLNVHAGCETSNYNSSEFEIEEKRKVNKEGDVKRFGGLKGINYIIICIVAFPFINLL